MTSLKLDPRFVPPEWQDQEDCRTVLQMIDRVGDKWTVMVVSVLATGPVRFNAIMRAIHGISHRMLTLTLRGLEQDGLVKRTDYETVPPKVEYELTDLGRSLIEPLTGLGLWVAHNRLAIEKARLEFVRKQEAATGAMRSSLVA